MFNILRATNARQERKRYTTAHQLPEPSKAHTQRAISSRAARHIRLTRLAMRALFQLFFRVRVEGLENLTATRAIICPNHLGWADPFLVLLFFPAEPRIR